MQGYNPGLQGHHAVAQPPGSLHDHGSPSGSDDDAGYLAYPESHKMEPGVDGTCSMHLRHANFRLHLRRRFERCIDFADAKRRWYS